MASTPTRLDRLGSHPRKRLENIQSMRVTGTIKIPTSSPRNVHLQSGHKSVITEHRLHSRPWYHQVPCPTNLFTVFRDRGHNSFGLRHSNPTLQSRFRTNQKIVDSPSPESVGRARGVRCSRRFSVESSSGAQCFKEAQKLRKNGESHTGSPSSDDR